MRGKNKIEGKKKQENKAYKLLHTDHSILNNTSNINNMNINEASSNQLKQIIQKLITKSRSLISSLESTLQQLQEVKIQKNYWKKHYFSFKTACQKYVESRGIAPFQYIQALEKNLKEASFRNQEHTLQSRYRSLSTTKNKNFNCNNSLKVNNQEKQFEKVDLPQQTTQIFNSNSHQFMLPSHQSAYTKAYTHEQQSLRSDIKNKTIEKQFTGIKLGGKQISNRKQKLGLNSPIKLTITHQNRNKTNSFYKRKDSLQTKKIYLLGN